MKAIKFFILISFILAGCHPAGTKKEASSPSEALTLVRINYPLFYDDMNYKELETAINRNIKYLMAKMCRTRNRKMTLAFFFRVCNSSD